MPSWTPLLRPLADDVHRGASELYRDALDIIATHLTEPVDNRGLAAAIRAVHPEMAPFQFLADQLGDVENVGERVAELSRQIDEADRKIAELVGSLPRDSRPIMLHSYSGTTVRAIVATISRQTPIYISEAAPDHEGMLVAQRLNAAGYSVTTFPDDARLSFLRECAAVFVGSDWIDESDFTNKIGTYTLFSAAQDIGTPAYVIAEQIKLAPRSRRIPRPEIVQRLHGSVRYHRRLLEETPNRLASGFIMDRGILSVTDVARHFETRGLTP